MTLAVWISLAIIHVTAVITPGANFLAVTQTALTRSRRAGLWVARGIITGSIIHVTAGMIGFAAVISRIPLLFATIRLLGGLYRLHRIQDVEGRVSAISYPAYHQVSRDRSTLSTNA